MSLADGFLALGHGDGNWESGCFFLSSCFLVLVDRDVKKWESLTVMALLFS